jgi:hypothetical protein
VENHAANLFCKKVTPLTGLPFFDMWVCFLALILSILTKKEIRRMNKTQRKGTKSLAASMLVWLIIVMQVLGGWAGVAAADSGQQSVLTVQAQAMYTQAEGTRTITVPQAIEEAVQWILAQGPVTDDWYAYSLSQAGKTVESGYLPAAKQQLAGFNAQTLPTDYARLALAVKAAGGNPASFEGVNLLEKIYNHPKLTSQGSNGVIYGLLALDSASYQVPGGALWNQESMAAWLLEHQIPNEGWSLDTASVTANVDITGAVLWALAPYKSRTDVKAAVDQAVAWLAAQQFANGDVTADRSNSNSLSTVILGLSSQQKDGRQGVFGKADGDLLSSLFRYMNSDGGFSLKEGTASEGFTTYQALLALLAFNQLTGGQGGDFEAPISSGSTSGKAKVFTHIEKPDGVMAEGIENAANPLEALQQLAARNSLEIETSDVPFFDIVRIGNVGKPYLGYYWSFNIKRNGNWTNEWDWKNTVLKDGDELAVFFGSYPPANMLGTIELTPDSPKSNEPFSVKVTQYDSAGATVSGSVYVQIGSQKIWTDAQGVGSFPLGYTDADKQIAVTGALVNGLPTMIRGVKQLQPNVSIRVEGMQDTLTSRSVHGTTVYAALANSVTDVVYTDGKYFSVDKINGVALSNYDWWGFAVKRAGSWIATDGWKTTMLQEGDEVVAYYSGMDTQLVRDVTVTPAVPKIGQSFTVKVEQENWQGASVAPNVKVQVGNQQAVTNELGIALFNSGLPEGSYPLVVTGYLTGQAPLIVKHTSNLSVSGVQVSEGGGSGGGGQAPVGNTVKISVEGDSSQGVILSSQNISWFSGDTAYSVLIRALGTDAVTITGTGSNIYVTGINGLYQFDKGAKSGWMYGVNCSFPDTSAGGYAVRNGDRIDWRYTLNSGDDVKAALRNSCSSSNNGSGSSGSSGSSSVSQQTEDGINQVSIGYSNRLPADPNVQTVSIVNADMRMTASEADQLRQQLASNQVALEKALFASQLATLTDAAGEISLDIPAQALKQDTAIEVKELDSPAYEELVSSLYEFAPNGTNFAKPVFISIKTPLDDRQLEGLALAWLDEQANKWIPIPASIDARTGIITGKVDHFTKFAVIDKSKLQSTVAVQATGALDTLGKAIDSAVSNVLAGDSLSDWEAFALAAAGTKVPVSYMASAESMLKEKNGQLRLVTDYERLALGVQAAGGNPQQTAGYDLIKSIYTSARMTDQGTNGPVFALLVLSNGGYSVPADALWTKDKLLTWVIGQQNSDGGWPVASGDPSNVDLTAMALASLASYQDQPEVKTAVSKALLWLSQMQQPSGGFQLEAGENSESAAQVLLALASLGIDPLTDSRFVKNGATLVTNLLGYQQADGGFAHVKGQASGEIATEQSLLALAKYRQLARSKQVQTVEPTVLNYVDRSDISPWAVEFVRKATLYGLMEGMSEQELRFAPKQQLTRAQFVKMTLMLMNVPVAANVAGNNRRDVVMDGNPAFNDVKSDSWYYNYVLKAVELGIVNGVSDSMFAPDQSMSRQDMALVIARAFKLSTGSAGQSSKFSDLNEASEQGASAIHAVSEHGYMEGDDLGKFHPISPVTREMAAAVMVRIYDKTRK